MVCGRRGSISGAASAPAVQPLATMPGVQLQSRHSRPRSAWRSVLAVLAIAGVYALPASAFGADQPDIASPSSGAAVATPTIHVSWSENDPADTTGFDLFVDTSSACAASGSPLVTVGADAGTTQYSADVNPGSDGQFCVIVVARATPGGSDASASVWPVMRDTTAPDPPGGLAA